MSQSKSSNQHPFQRLSPCWNQSHLLSQQFCHNPTSHKTRSTPICHNPTSQKPFCHSPTCWMTKNSVTWSCPVPRNPQQKPLQPLLLQCCCLMMICLTRRNHVIVGKVCWVLKRSAMVSKPGFSGRRRRMASITMKVWNLSAVGQIKTTG